MTKKIMYGRYQVRQHIHAKYYYVYDKLCGETVSPPYKYFIGRRRALLLASRLNKEYYEANGLLGLYSTVSWWNIIKG